LDQPLDDIMPDKSCAPGDQHPLAHDQGELVLLE